VSEIAAKFDGLFMLSAAKHRCISFAADREIRGFFLSLGMTLCGARQQYL